MTQPMLVSVPEAAKRLGIGRDRCWDLVHTGELPHVRFGVRYLVPIHALSVWVARNTPEPRERRGGGAMNAGSRPEGRPPGRGNERTPRPAQDTPSARLADVLGVLRRMDVPPDAAAQLDQERAAVVEELRRVGVGPEATAEVIAVVVEVLGRMLGGMAWGDAQEREKFVRVFTLTFLDPEAR